MTQFNKECTQQVLMNTMFKNGKNVVSFTPGLSHLLLLASKTWSGGQFCWMWRLKLLKKTFTHSKLYKPRLCIIIIPHWRVYR